MTEPTANASNSMEIENEEVYVPSGSIHSVKRIVATWAFDCSTDTCAICRNGITSTSINYEASKIGTEERKDSCKIAFLSCGHPFHYDCIKSWHRQRPNTCPLCNREKLTFERIDIVPGHEAEV